MQLTVFMFAEHGKQKGVKTMNQTCKDCLFYQPINAGCGICCYDIMVHEQHSPADGFDDLVQAFDVSCVRFREAHVQKNCRNCRHYESKQHENAGICMKPRPRMKYGIQHGCGYLIRTFVLNGKGR